MKRIIILFILFSLVSSKQSIAQSGDFYSAHFRMINTSILVSMDSRAPALFLTPTADLLFKGGKIVAGGHYNLEFTRSMPYDASRYKNETILSAQTENLNRKFGGFEIYAGYNFVSNYNDNIKYISIFRSGTTGTVYKTVLKEEAERSLFLGGHAGLGRMNSNVGTMRGFDIADANGKRYNTGNDTIDGRTFPYEIFAQAQTLYTYVGVHLLTVAKPYSKGNRVWGGRRYRAYIDAIIPVNVTMDDLYSAGGDPYFGVPKAGKEWKKLGYRFGMIKTGTGTFSSTSKFEIGKMPSFSTLSMRGPSPLYFSLGFGVAISPKYSPYRID